MENDVIFKKLLKHEQFHILRAFRNFDGTAVMHKNYLRSCLLAMKMIPDNTKAKFGFKVAGKSYVPVLMFYQPWSWEKTEPEASTFGWVVMFMGCDDQSWFVRFRQRRDAWKYANEIKELNSTEGMLSYN